MTEKRDLLVEIGTEELPPKSLLQLARAFAGGVVAGLEDEGLPGLSHHVYAAPRRLAVLISGVPVTQADSRTERRGPALAAAFDPSGEPTKAAEGFARSCGVAVGDLQSIETDKGAWLAYTVKLPGRSTTELIEDIVAGSLAKLPIPKRMRWGAGDVEFVRPVHWVCVVYGDRAVDCQVLGLPAGNTTRGHRFHANHEIVVTSAGQYAGILFDQGVVVVDFERRRELIAGQVAACADELNGNAVLDDDLLDEVTSLVEWPVAIVAGFEEKYLELPEQVLITTLQEHQKYIPLRSAAGELMPTFITIANIDSSNPEAVRRGNERVVRPRLADAMFFLRRDRKTPLASRQAALGSVLFQKQLGSLADKSARVAALAMWIAQAIGADPASVKRTCELAKCDLLTDMVGEFPSLQGVMGEYYARHDGEPETVAVALREQYLPRFASDSLPASDTGRALAIAERIDTLVGIFAIGQKPTGVKDPFALRRAALGALRIVIECQLALGLPELVAQATGGLDKSLLRDDLQAEVVDFMMDRLKAYYRDRGVSPQIFEAVKASAASREPYDFDRRITAVKAFESLPEAHSLSAANKRIRNILNKSQAGDRGPADPGLFVEQQERDLHRQLLSLGDQLAGLLAGEKRYTEALTLLAGLREPVDDFFDKVMVMADDESVRNNRLALLRQVVEQFNRIADISRLQQGSA